MNMTVRLTPTEPKDARASYSGKRLRWTKCSPTFGDARTNLKQIGG